MGSRLAITPTDMAATTADMITKVTINIAMKLAPA